MGRAGGAQSGAAGPLRSIAVLFAASGAAGLVHEVAWARALGQSLGNSLQALTAVLVAFLGGLALGAALGARAAGRLAFPLRAYALLEIFVGLYGLTSPLVAVLPVRLLQALGPAVAPDFPLAALRLLLALAVLLPPTMAMGATLPLLVREGVRRGAAPAAALSVLYAVNTLGAAAGAPAGSFLLLPFLGTRLTFVSAGLLNLAAAAVAVALDRRGGAARAREPGSRPAPLAPAGVRPVPGPAGLSPTDAPRAALVLAAAALSGLAGALLQVGWTRVVALSFGSSVYALGIVLTAYILGLGIGPLLVRGLLGRPGSAAAVAGASEGALGLLSLMLLPALGALPLLAAMISGRLGGDPIPMIAAQLVLVVLLLLLPALAQGASFPALAMLARGGDDPHGAAGRVYAASTCGAVLGYLLAGFTLLPALGTRRTLESASVAALILAAGLPFLAESRAGDPARRRRRTWIPAVSLLFVVPLLLSFLPRWDASIMSGGGFLYGPIYGAALGRGRVEEAMRRRGPLLYERDGGEALVTVRRSPAGILSMQINGKTEASTGGDMATQLLAGHLPLLAHPRPEEVLVIGLASGVTLGAVERHPVASIRVIEIAPAVIEAARLFTKENGHALDDPRVRIVIDDARSWLLARRQRYDVITSQPSNPWVAGVSNLFTVEFYRLARSRLKPGGLFCQWVQAYRLSPGDLRGIVRSFLMIFPEATLWEESAGGGDYFLLGGDRPLRIDPARLEGPRAAGALADLRRAGIGSAADLLARFVAGPRSLDAFAGGVSPHTDDNLYLEWSAPLSLFRDTLKEQAAALRRHRDPPLSILPVEIAAREPALMAALRQSRLRDESRLALLDSLRDADLWALRDPYLAAGIEDLRAGLFTDAAAALSRGATENPQSASVHLLLGEAYRAAGLQAPAAIAFRAAVERDPGLAAAWNELGGCALDEGLTDRARAAFERAIEEDPALPSARNNLGTVLLRTGDLDGAERRLREALAIDPSLAAARANLGLLLKRRGDLPGAEREYRAALGLDPLNADARYDLAILLRESGRLAEARAELTLILRDDPDDRLAAEALKKPAAR